MVKKKDDIHDYLSAHDAAQILSQKLARPIRPDCICKLARSKKRSIRIARFGDRLMYHREDIQGATIRQRKTPWMPFDTEFGTYNLPSRHMMPLYRRGGVPEEMPSMKKQVSQ